MPAFLNGSLVQTSGRGTVTPSQRDQELQKENLKLASENLELRFQLEQSNVDLPRLKVDPTPRPRPSLSVRQRKRAQHLISLCLCLFFQNQVADMKEMCAALKKENLEVKKKLSHIQGVSYCKTLCLCF